MYDRILAPTDGSDAAKKAVAGASALADQFNAPLHVNHVIDRSELPGQVESDVTAELAQQGEATVIVMGTHGRSGLVRCLIGSVTEKVVRLAEMPVLAVSPRDST